MNLNLSVESPVWMQDGIVANGLFPDFTLIALRSTRDEPRLLAGSPPFTPRRIAHATGRRLLNRNFLASDPQRKRLALSYQYEPRIDFFTSDGAQYGSVTGPRSTRPRWRVESDRFFWDDSNEMAYWRIDATDRYVYTLFCGCQDRENRMPSLLHVYRWNGDFVAEIALDREVTSFAVAPDDTLLYASVRDPYPAVGEWRLPERLRAAR